MTCSEPFKKLLTQGMVLSQTYKNEATGKYLTKDEVDTNGNDITTNSDLSDRLTIYCIIIIHIHLQMTVPYSRMLIKSLLKSYGRK